MLEVRDVHTAYGLSRVLFGVSIAVGAGECVCLLGRNGVGKTTTLRSIIGLTPPSAGRVVWKGQDITGWPPYRIARAGIGLVPEDRRIFADLTVWENLDVASRAGRSGVAPVSGRPRSVPASRPPLQWTIERVFDLFPTLRELTTRPGGYLSGGEQQMLTIARTLMGNPELLLLDEPSEGLAPIVVDHLREQIARLKREGLTILLAEQNVGFSLALADRVYVLEKGSIRFSGSAAALRDNEALRHEMLAL
ncbi:MAG: ABC transporter ATP-binding protein [Candidatus Rokubacteria bacterium]|nr:ABC transporter ATP-binding protein [Candidatus Rokubacteria bacterium]